MLHAFCELVVLDSCDRLGFVEHSALCSEAFALCALTCMKELRIQDPALFCGGFGTAAQVGASKVDKKQNDNGVHHVNAIWILLL